MYNPDWNAKQQDWSAYVEASMKEKGITRKKLAEMTGIKLETLRNWLRLRTRPDLPRLIVIARALDQEPVKYLELLGLIEPGYTLSGVSELSNIAQELGSQIANMERLLSDAHRVYDELLISIQHIYQTKPSFIEN